MRPTLTLPLLLALCSVARAQEPITGHWDVAGTRTDGTTYRGQARIDAEGTGLVLRERLEASTGERVLRATLGPTADRWTFRGREVSTGGLAGTVGGTTGATGAEVVLVLQRCPQGGDLLGYPTGARQERFTRRAASDLAVRLGRPDRTRFAPHRPGGASIGLQVQLEPRDVALDVALKVQDKDGAVVFTQTLRGAKDEGFGVAAAWDGKLSKPGAGYADARRSPYRVTASVTKDGRTVTSEPVAVTAVPHIDACYVVSRARAADGFSSTSKLVAYGDVVTVTGVVRAAFGGARVDQPGKTLRATFSTLDPAPARVTIAGVGAVPVQRWDEAAWGGLALEWQTIHALGLHSPAYKATQDSTRMTRDGEFTNVISNGPAEGTWVGRDVLEYRHAAAGTGPSPALSDSPGTVRVRFDADYADASLALGARRPGSPGKRDPVATTAAQARSGLLDGVDPNLAGAGASIHRISRRGPSANPLLSHLEAFRGVPWLYGSLGEQVTSFVGYDCADLVFAAARNAGLTTRTQFTNANNFCRVYMKPRGAERVIAWNEQGAMIDARTKAPVTLRCGGGEGDPRPGDVVFFDWDADGDWDHTTVLWSCDGELGLDAQFVWAHHQHDSVDGFYVGSLSELVGPNPPSNYRMTIRKF